MDPRLMWVIGAHSLTPRGRRVLWTMCLNKQRQGGKNSEKIYKRKCQPRPLLILRKGCTWWPEWNVWLSDYQVSPGLRLISYWSSSNAPIVWAPYSPRASLSKLWFTTAPTPLTSPGTHKQTNTHTRYITTIWLHLRSTIHMQSYIVLVDAFKKVIFTGKLILVLDITNHDHHDIRKGTQMINWATMEVSHQLSLLSLISNGSSSSSRSTILFTHFPSTWVTHKPNQEKAKLLILDF